MSRKITFGELAGYLSERTGRSQRFTREFVRELTGIIEAGLRSSGSVSISGFGRFELRWMNERRGINPRTGDEILIEGHNKVVFKPYKALREEVGRTTALSETRIPGDGRTSRQTAAGKSLPEREPGYPPEQDLEEILKEKPSPLGPRFKKPATTPAAAPEASPVRTADKPPAPRIGDKSHFRWSWLAACLLLLLILLIWYGEQEPDTSSAYLSANSAPALTAPEVATASPEGRQPEIQPEDLASTGETTYRSIRIEPGQTLWSLAEEHLDDPYLWPWIFRLNPEVLHPDRILTGAALTLPVPADTENLEERDLREVARGYLDIYNLQRDQGSADARYFLWAAGSWYPDLLEEMDHSVDPADLFFARSY